MSYRHAEKFESLSFSEQSLRDERGFDGSEDMVNWLVESGRRSWSIWKVELESWEDDNKLEASEVMSSSFTNVLVKLVSGGLGVCSGDGGRKVPGILC